MLQAALSALETYQEEMTVTFQIALVGVDGIILGSDRSQLCLDVRQDGVNRPFQTSSAGKIYVSDDRSIVCCHAGGPASDKTARAIATARFSVGLSDLQWTNRLYEIAETIEGTHSLMLDEVLVVRTLPPISAKRVTRQGKGTPTVMAVTQQMCAGDNSPARFLPTHLWRADARVSELKALALLTLHYAHTENPTGVGGGYDIVTIGENGEFSSKYFAEDAVTAIASRFDLTLREGLNNFSVSFPPV